MTQRLLAAAAPDLRAHTELLGPVPWRGGPGLLLATIEESGLLGRGGGGFPTWRKLAAVRSGKRPVVIANAAEGEPASAKDRTLLSRAPHLVLDGLQLAIEAVGATRGHVYAPEGPAADAVSRALAERRQARTDRVRVDLHVAPDTFISGEESAAVAHVEGSPALPRDKRLLVAESGVSGRPTLVQNVETLAHLALIARFGAEWFRQVGTREEPGTFLATVSGAIRRPGVYEAPYGVPLASLLAQAGGANEPVQALLVGGYHGAWLPATELAKLTMSRAALRPWGASPGAGIVFALPTRRCGLVESARMVTYLAGQSARQCGPCLNGLPAMARTLESLASARPAHGAADELARLSALVEGRGACAHPDGTVRLVRSTLRTFADEIDHHLAGRCGAAFAKAS
jgi:NADH:ubiquinone oxidoreductase subunit F (NADH-binding)